MEAAIMSETPVPLPECMSTRMTVAAPERNMRMSRMTFRKFTVILLCGSWSYEDVG